MLTDCRYEKEEGDNMQDRKRVRFGMPTLIELDSLEANAMLCQSLGLDFVEINMNFPQYQIDMLEPEKILDLMSKYNIDFTIHIAEDIDVAHFNPLVREAYYRTISQVVDIMKQCHLKVLNMHMTKGIHVTLPTQKVLIYDKYFDQYIKNLNDFATYFTESVKGTDIRLGVENTVILDLDYIAKGKETLIKFQAIGLTLDVGHDYSSDFKDSYFYERHKENLIHMHLHDALGSDNHLTLNSGEVAVRQFIDLAKEKQIDVVLEIKTCASLTQSVDYLKEIGVVGCIK